MPLSVNNSARFGVPDLRRLVITRRDHVVRPGKIRQI